MAEQDKMEVDTENREYDYDLVVIGGGSGGMAAAKEAATHGAKVALFDYVKPSSQGTTWGLGGTCVNVGCIPKKLMHYAGLLGENFADARALGWKFNVEDPGHDWLKMRQTVQNYIKQLNFGYRVGLTKKVKYTKALAEFVDPHTIKFTKKNKTTGQVTAKNVLIATGGRPHIPDDVPGAREYAISSDDVFSLKKAPGKTLCVGASYISLECAGFLHSLGYDTSVAVRSILLRGFDRQCADYIGENMKQLGMKFLWKVLPTKIEKTESGRLLVTFTNGTTDEFDTVLYATGRAADTAGLKLENAGVQTNKRGKFEVTNEQTNVPHIYAVGDVLAGQLELTPVAIQAGELLARRLFAGASEQMDYNMVPTTVFTPWEYGCVGLSEEDAEAKYGKDNIETYLFGFKTLEHSACHRKNHDGSDELPPPNLSKLVCLKTEGERVVGFHYVGPNAGEITQGFALAVRLGAKKSDFDKTVGLHPTDAESFCALTTTRRSGEEFIASGGCGGGKCG